MIYKVFGREPALIVAVIGGLLTFAASTSVPGLSAGAASAIAALVSAGVMAWATRPFAPAAFTGVIAAAVAVLAQYNLHVPDATVGALTGLVLAVFALLTRGQVSPMSGPVEVLP